MELAYSAHRVNCRCFGVDPFEQMESTDWMFWYEVAEVAMNVINYSMRTQATMNYEVFAKILFGALTVDIDEKWNKLDQHAKLVWIAVGRHLINCMMYRDEKLDLKEAEAHWPKWVNDKLGVDQGELVYDYGTCDTGTAEGF